MPVSPRLFDRGLAPNYINQGGQDIVFSGRRDFDLDEHTRAVATGEYLSSFVYREAFAQSFALAVASQVTSSAFITHNDAGRSASISFDRYQNFEGTTQVDNTFNTPQIRILRVPSLDFNTIDNRLQDAVALEHRWLRGRIQPQRAGLQDRSDRPLRSLSPPLAARSLGWLDAAPGSGRSGNLSTGKARLPAPRRRCQGMLAVNRSDLEASFELRPPALVRDFKAPALERLFGGDLRHTIEPEIHYRYVAGVNNFSSIPRFDTTDVVSDTNEMEYSLTQKLFFKHLHPKPCSSGELPPPINGTITLPATYTECGGDTDAMDYLEAGCQILLRPVLRGRRRLPSGAMCWRRRST